MSEAATTGLALVTEWLSNRKPDVELHPDLDLIETRFIDSLSLTEFVMLIEEASGKRVSLSQFNANTIRTLAALQRAYFS